MPLVPVNLGERGYPIHIGRGLMERLGEKLRSHFPPSTRLLVVGDHNTLSLFGEKARHSLREAGYDAAFFRVPVGEKAKDLGQVARVAGAAAGFGLGRDGLFLALGGGVVGDLTGFCAASYMRGVSLVQVPTTLLAQVDSSVGGKVAVNLPGGKNLLGFFLQPRLVLMDVAVLDPLPLREFCSGVMEIIKYGIMADPLLFNTLEDKMLPGGDLPRDLLEEVIFKSCCIKRDVVVRDEREEGPRMILNLGHTLGHALERETGYEYYRHGEAVGLGLAWAARLSERLGLLPSETAGRIGKLLERGKLPPVPAYVTVEGLLAAMGQDKKRRRGKGNFVLIRGIGRVEVVPDVPPALVRETVTEFMEVMKGGRSEGTTSP